MKLYALQPGRGHARHNGATLRAPHRQCCLKGVITVAVNHSHLIELGLNFPGASLKFPFRLDLPVLDVRGKMFALLGRHGNYESVNLKTSPEEAGFQRQEYPGSVIPGYHMNKEHWNTVILNGSVPDGVVIEMLHESYQRVVAKLPHKDKLELGRTL